MRVENTGEDVALKYELNRLKAYPNLVRKIERKSLISDNLGYDILSFEKDGRPRYIEVKASSDKAKDKFEFILSENERHKALELDN